MSDDALISSRSSFSYLLQQSRWIVWITLKLIVSMGVGVQWVLMAARMLLYCVFVGPFNLSLLAWYVVTPSVIRHVAYRSSQRTKLEQLHKVLIAEGVIHSRASLSDAVLILNSDPLCLDRLVEECHQPTDRESSSSSFTTPPQPKCSNSSKKDVLKQAVTELPESENDHNRAYLDIFLPVPVDTFLSFAPVRRWGSHASFNGSPTHEPLNGSKKLYRKFPMVIFVSGGAWIIGYYFWSVLLAKLLAARGYLVFVPDYRNFPQTTLEGMVVDVEDAVSWVLANGERYNGDLDNVTLMGQSAGAHLTLLAIVRQARLVAQDEHSNTTTSLEPPPLSHSSVLDDNKYSPPLHSPHRCLYRFNPRRDIHHCIGLCGLYQLPQLFKYLGVRGLSPRVLQLIAGGTLEHVKEFSVVRYFMKHSVKDEDFSRMSNQGVSLVAPLSNAPEKSRSNGGDLCPVLPTIGSFRNLVDPTLVPYLPRRLSILHGEADKSAPVTESRNLAFIINEAILAYLDVERNKNSYVSMDSFQGNMETTTTSSSSSGVTEESSSRSPLQEKEEYPSPALSVLLPSLSNKNDITDSPPDVHFYLIKGATHTDTILEEPMHGSSVVLDFIEGKVHPVEGAYGDGSGKKKTNEKGDDVLLLTMDPHQYHLMLRIGRWVCPF